MEETLESKWRAEWTSCSSCPQDVPSRDCGGGKELLPALPPHALQPVLTSHVRAGREAKLSYCGLRLQGAVCCHLPNGCRQENGRRVASLSWYPALQPWLKKRCRHGQWPEWSTDTSSFRLQDMRCWKLIHMMGEFAGYFVFNYSSHFSFWTWLCLEALFSHYN